MMKVITLLAVLFFFSSQAIANPTGEKKSPDFVTHGVDKYGKATKTPVKEYPKKHIPKIYPKNNKSTKKAKSLKYYYRKALNSK